MHKRPFGYDPVTGVVETHFYDPYEDVAVVQTTQDVTPFIEAAKGLSAPVDERARWGDKTFHHVAFIPDSVILEHQKRGINLLEDKAELKKWLNNPDNKVLRTRPGRI